MPSEVAARKPGYVPFQKMFALRLSFSTSVANSFVKAPT